MLELKLNLRRQHPDKLYTFAIENLRKQGYTINWFKNIKNQIKMAQFDQDVVKAVMKKVKKQYGDKAVIKFYIPRTLNTLAGVTLNSRLSFQMRVEKVKFLTSLRN